VFNMGENSEGGDSEEHDVKRTAGGKENGVRECKKIEQSSSIGRNSQIRGNPR